MLKLNKIYWTLILLFCLCAVIDNLLISNSENRLEISSKTEVKSIKINPQFKKYAHSISVKVISKGKDSGSGVVIGKQGNKYLVLTNDSVVRNHDNIIVKTADGVNHQAAIMGFNSFFGSADDTALLSFSSGNNYQPVQLNRVDTGVEKKRIYAVGYSADMDKFIVEPGTIERIPIQSFKKGYQIGYTSNIDNGMSGGAILDELGDLVGINGNGASDLSYTDFRYEEDRTKPTPAEIKQFKSLNWGLSTHRLLTKLNSETLTDLKIIKAYGLPIPETVDDIASTQLTGWLADLETEAKQITVRIDSSSEANGSGAIIAKQGNTYTVLTADHVLCEKDGDNKCIDYTYEIVTPDGEKHTLDASTVKAEAGVDLATFKFTSNESYQVAQLADYPIQDDDAVFVAGYPQLDSNAPPQWLFSLGFGLNKEQGLLSVNISSNSSDNENSAAISQISLAGGYEMVYTSPTYGGMSGGAVLDKDGRVIGIHGQAEGETTIDSQGGASNKIQMGYSLGIPISTFMGLKARLGVGEISSIGSNASAELNSKEQEAFEAAILGMEIFDSNATAKRWLERGNRLWRLARYEEAVNAFDKAIDLNEAEFNYLAHYGKGLSLWYDGKTEAALRSLELATEIQPNFASAFFHKSALLRSIDRLESALVAIEKAISLQPDNANYYSEKGINLADLKRYSEAENAFKQALFINPRSGFYNNRGHFYQNRGKPKLALSDLNKALSIDPNGALAYNNRGNIYLDKGKLELALADYNKALTIDPNDALAYNNRGNIYQKSGNLKLALSDINKAITINPNNANFYNNRGHFHRDQGKTELALADYNKALAIEPNNVDSYYNRGTIYQKSGKLKLALSDYNSALIIDSNFADAYLNRGNLYSDQGKLELAIADYNQAIAIEPNDASVYYNRGNLYSNQGKLELAIADYNRTITINPKHIGAYNNRGNIYSDQGKLELAIADYNRAIAIEPNDASGYNNRGIVYFYQKKLKLALSDYNKVLDINPNNANAYYNRGIVYQVQGKRKLALSDYKQALEIAPKYAEVYGNIGLVHAELGNIKEARFNLEKSQQLFAVQDNTQGKEKSEYFLQQLLELEQSELPVSNDRTPQSADEHYDRAFEYHQQQEYDRALADYSQAIELDPDREKAYVNRGLVYYNLGKDEDAIADYNKAIEINPNNPNSYQNRGVVYFEREEYELAEADWSKAIALNPEDAQAYYNRSFLYLKLGNESLAKTDLETARRLATSQNNTDLAKKTANALQQLP